MKKTIITVVAGLGIAFAVVPATTAVASASIIPSTSSSFATSMQVCTPWMIEHAIPCLPRTTAPTHRHHHHLDQQAHEHGRGHKPCHRHH